MKKHRGNLSPNLESYLDNSLQRKVPLVNYQLQYIYTLHIYICNTNHPLPFLYLEKKSKNILLRLVEAQLEAELKWKPHLLRLSLESKV